MEDRLTLAARTKEAVDDLIGMLLAEQKAASEAESPGDLIGKTAADACHAVLSDSNEPLSRQELFDAANARGAGIKEIANLSSILSRDERFEGVGTGRGAKWTLKAAQ